MIVLAGSSNLVKGKANGRISILLVFGAGKEEGK
jgi:hypothetical protein